MPFDATLGGASANSYLTVAEADAYANSDLGRNRTAWLAATVEDKEAALMRATEEIDATIVRVDSTFFTGQALLFPRSYDLDPSDDTLPKLPARLGNAVYLQAAYIIRNADLLDDAASRRARGLANFSNPDGTSGQVAEDPRWGTLHPRVDRMLDEYTSGSVIATIIPT
jgi:hypothetical protein